MKKGIKVSLLLSLMITISSCAKLGLCKDDELSLQRIAYNGEELKTNGYYYGNISTSGNWVHIYYLYKNGVFLTTEASELNLAEAGTITVDIENVFGKTVKPAWGTFQINGNTIEIEHWQSVFAGCMTTIYEKGRIINDTTFLITSREYRKKGKVKRTTYFDDNYFYFRPLPAKPDSVNSFVK